MDAAGWKQKRLAEALTEAMDGETTSQGAVSKWLAGKSAPTRTKVAALERLLRLSEGELANILWTHYISAVLGPVESIEDAIANDPGLSGEQKAALLAHYRAYLSGRGGGPAVTDEQHGDDEETG